MRFTLPLLCGRRSESGKVKDLPALEPFNLSYVGPKLPSKLKITFLECY